MKHYSMFHAPIMSFFSTRFYRDVGLHWKGIGFVYILLLLAVCWIPSFVLFQIAISDYIGKKAPPLTIQIPTIRITNGEAVVDVKQPYRIADPDSGKTLAIIDTTGNTPPLELAETMALLTRTTVFIKKSDVETRSFSLKNVGNFTLNRERVSRWIEIFRRYATVASYPFAVVGSFVFRIVQLLIYAVIGLLFAKWCKTTIQYRALLRLSAMAVTPVIICSTVVGVADFKIPFHNVVYFFGAMVFLFIGVRAISKEGEYEGIRDDVR